MRVLIVDDSRTTRARHRGILAQMGHTTIEEAGDGADALARLDAFDPELVVVDRNMPGMDGLEFTRSFRAMGRTAPVVLLTTETARSSVIAAIKAGVDNYIVKPCTPDVLAQRIEETIARARAT